MRELKGTAGALSQIYSYSSLVLWTAEFFVEIEHLFITAKYESALLTKSLEATFSDINCQIVDLRPLETLYYVTYDYSTDLYR